MGIHNDEMEEVREEDLEMFYSFFDEIVKEESRELDKKMAEDEAEIDKHVAEWAPEPFPEYVAGVSYQEDGKYYAMSSSGGYATRQGEDVKGGVTGLAIFASFVAAFAATLSIYAVMTSSDKPRYAAAAVAQPVAVAVAEAEADNGVNELKQQLQGVESRLQELSNLVVERQQPVAVSRPVARAEVVKVTKPQARPVLAAGGEWIVNLSSSRDRDLALKDLDRLRGVGVAAQASDVEIRGKRWTRIWVGGFASKEQAQAAMPELATATGMSDLWIGKLK